MAAQLVTMGFPRSRAVYALAQANGDLEAARELMLAELDAPQPAAAQPAVPPLELLAGKQVMQDKTDPHEIRQELRALVAAGTGNNSCCDCGATFVDDEDTWTCTLNGIFVCTICSGLVLAFHFARWHPCVSTVVYSIGD